MRIGIVPALSGLRGGIYQYSLTMLRALNEWKEDGCQDEFVVFAEEVPHPALVSFNGRGWTVKPLDPPPPLEQQALHVLLRIIGEGPHREAWRWLRRRLRRVPRQGKVALADPDMVRSRPEMSRWFRRCNVELMLYPVPRPLSFETGVPYIMAIHDLQHRLQQQFPEVSADGEWEWREYYFRNGSRYATLLLADSEVGREDILTFYGPHGVTPDRVKVLPYLPAYYPDVDISESQRERVRTNYHLPERYLFYPAQFWPHKNHERIVQALGLIGQEYRLKIPIVFCGTYTGDIRERTFHKVMTLAHQLGVEEQIHCLGYVPDQHMAAMYAGAVALVMPTFFGPTNIPVLEAWAFGCPVLTSDIRGIREQAGDSAILADPKSVEAVADGIYRLWTDESLRSTLIERGRQRLSTYTSDDYRRTLIDILEDAKMRVCSEQPHNVIR